MNNKKSASFGLQVIVVLVITILFAVIYLVWLKDYRIFGENFVDYNICKDSNIESANLKLKISNQIITERKGNKCKTEYTEVGAGKEFQTIAKKMSGCWDMYLEGKEELFDTEDGTYCAICTVMKFKDKKEFSGFTKYLMEHKTPSGKTYYQYLTGISIKDDIIKQVENSELNKQKIDTGKDLAVIFLMGKDVNPGSLTGQSSIFTSMEGFGVAAAGLVMKSGFGLCSTIAGCAIGAFFVAAGATTGYLIGSDSNPNLDTRILLWPYANEDLKQLKCTVLEGKDRLDIRK